MTVKMPSRTGFSMTRRGALATLGAGAFGASALSVPRSARAQPKRGGDLKIGVSRGSTSNSLDPTTYTDWQMYMIGAAVCNSLVEIGPDKVPVPELATGWEASSDAKTWTFELRKGVEFSNGKPFTAADVIYSLNRHRGEGNKSPAAPFMSAITDIRADGDHTIVIEMSEGNAEMPIVLGAFQLVIIPEGHEDFSNLIGTGGYMVEEWDPGVKVAMSRNPNYWKSDRAWVDSVEILMITDPASRLNALLTGEVHAIDRVDPKTLPRVLRNPDFFLVENKGSVYQSSAMDSRAAPFNDNNVRTALKYAVNREELLQKINGGYGVVGNDHPVPPNDPNWNADIPQRPYDPDQAKFWLKKAGLDSIDVALSAADTAFTGAVDAAVLFKEHALPGGINLEVVREPNDGYWSNVWLKKPFTMVNWGVRATPTVMFELAYKCGAPWADGFLCDDRFETLLKEAKVATDPAKRKEIIGEMQMIQYERGSNHVFMFVSALDLYSKKVGDVAEDAVGAMMGTRICERAFMV